MSDVKATFGIVEGVPENLAQTFELVDSAFRENECDLSDVINIAAMFVVLGFTHLAADGYFDGHDLDATMTAFHTGMNKAIKANIAKQDFDKTGENTTLQ